MRFNRSIPPVTVIPVLTYSDVPAAATWLVSAFGAVKRVQIGEDHRVQMSIGDGAFVVAEPTDRRLAPDPGAPGTVSIMVRVEDVGVHCDDARAAGATIISEPTDYLYGERQYTALDLAGHSWTFTESIADIAPEDYGSTTVQAWQKP